LKNENKNEIKMSQKWPENGYCEQPYCWPLCVLQVVLSCGCDVVAVAWSRMVVVVMSWQLC
jgi:hypothetical protein